MAQPFRQKLVEDLIKVVHEQQIDKVWLCRSCGKLTTYWEECYDCETKAEEQFNDEDQDV